MSGYLLCAILPARCSPLRKVVQPRRYRHRCHSPCDGPGILASGERKRQHYQCVVQNRSDRQPRNFSQRSSSSKMRTSTSRVNRGRPNKDAATPPMMRPETFSDWSHAIRAPSVISGGRTGGFLATVGPAELCPSSPHFFHSVRAGLPPTEVLSPSQKRVQLPELACNRCPPQLLFLFGVDSVPPPLKGSSLRLSHLLFHSVWPT